ncbi:hypothetical protein PQR67_13515 [Paraburkholderia fungorum]|uniref:hypothetical protein n=1 Tax=Paraburkholderia fungorum TaxID=134537 RepID=UPI0038BCCE68
MKANMTVYVPAGTVITGGPNGTFTTVSGSSNTVYVQAGVFVTVSASATGPATNVVTTASTSGNVQLSVTSLAGSAAADAAHVDGTGAAAVFWGGGRLAIDSSGNVVLFDGCALRKVKQAGVVTTLTNQGCWDGVAIDPARNVYGSGGGSVNGTSPVTWGASLYDFLTSGVSQQLFANWENPSVTSSTGFGGLVMDRKGALFLADSVNDRIAKFNIGSNTWTVFAGSGTSGNQDGAGTAVSFTGVSNRAIDSNDNLYVRSIDTVRKIAPGRTVTTIASQLSAAGTIAVDKSGSVYTSGCQVIDRIASDGSVVSLPSTTPADLINSLASDSSSSLYAATQGRGAQIFKIAFPNQ